MDLAGYVALTRQSGLAKELQSVANNIANLSTTGYRREGVIFAEEVRALPLEGGSVAMTAARARYSDELQGTLQETAGTLDLAIEGDIGAVLALRNAIDNAELDLVHEAAQLAQPWPGLAEQMMRTAATALANLSAALPGGVARGTR